MLEVCHQSIHLLDLKFLLLFTMDPSFIRTDKPSAFRKHSCIDCLTYVVFLSKYRNLKGFSTYERLFLRADLPPEHPQSANVTLLRLHTNSPNHRQLMSPTTLMLIFLMLSLQVQLLVLLSLMNSNTSESLNYVHIFVVV